MANTYFTNRITRSFKEWDALLAAPKVVFHAPRRVVSKDLTKILIQWKCEDLRKYLGGEILEIVDAGSTRGLELLAKKGVEALERPLRTSRGGVRYTD